MIIQRSTASGLHKAAIELVNGCGHDPNSFMGILPTTEGTAYDHITVLAKLQVLADKRTGRYDTFILMIEVEDGAFGNSWLLHIIKAECLNDEVDETTTILM